MKHRLLVLSAAIGAGHVKAAEALCQAYTEKFNGEALQMDFLRYASPTIGRIVEQSYYLMTKHTPFFYKFLYQITDRPGMTGGNFFEVRLGLNKYRQLVKEYQPDAILATHFLPAAVVSHMYPDFPIWNGVVITDYTFHQMWIHPNNQLFFVAHDGMAQELKAMGVANNRIRTTGIPINPRFSKQQDQKLLRMKLRMDRELPLLLVMSGGNAIGPMVEILQALADVTYRFQVAVIAGRNRKSYQELTQVFKDLQLTGRVLGLVHNMDEWMAAADLLISKAGGLTVAEALTSNLPMIIIRPTPGQEVGNTEFLTTAGTALHLEDLAELSKTVARLLRDPSKLAAMRQASQKLARPDATINILKEIDQAIAARSK